MGFFTWLFFFFSWKKLCDNRTSCLSVWYRAISTVVHQTCLGSHCSSAEAEKTKLIEFFSRTTCKQWNLSQFMHVHTCACAHSSSPGLVNFKEFSFPLPVAQVEHGRWFSPHQRVAQKNFTVKLCRATFLHAVVDILQEGSSSNGQVGYKWICERRKVAYGEGGILV